MHIEQFLTNKGVWFETILHRPTFRALGNGVPAMACHLTKEERDLLAQLLHRGFSQGQIAETLGRDPGTISRELAPNRVRGEYFAAQAQALAERRRRERPLVRKLDNPELNEAVRRSLVQNCSPEQIAGAQKRVHPLPG